MTTTRTRQCEVCGYEPEDGHNPEVHIAEMRAATNDYYETGGFPERDDYDAPPEDAVCSRCKVVGVEWNVEVLNAAGEWVTVCTDCETPADYVSQEPEDEDPADGQCPNCKFPVEEANPGCPGVHYQ